MTEFEGWLSFDLECNMAEEGTKRGPFYRRSTRLLCITTEDIATGEKKLYDMENVQEGLQSLLLAPGLVAHNGVDFDRKVITHLCPDIKDEINAVPMADTLGMSRQLFGKPGIKLLAYDLKNYGDSHFQPHALKNWGRRLKFPKMDSFENVDWATVDYTDLLGEYCMQDTIITTKLFWYLMKKREG